MSLVAALVVLVGTTPAAAPGADDRPGPGVRHYEDASGDLPNEPITAVAVAPMDDEVVYAGLDGFVFRSDDGGDTWRPVLSFPRGTALDPTDLETRAGVLQNLDDLPSTSELDYNDPAERRGGAYEIDQDTVDDEDLPDGDERTDGEVLDMQTDLQGAGSLPDGDAQTSATFDVTSWPREGPGVRTIAFVPGATGVVYIATPRGAYRSTASGESFERVAIPGGVLENDVRDIAIDPVRPSRVYLATAAGLFISRDGGGTFQKGPGQLADGAVLCVTAGVIEGVVHVLAGTTRGLWRSTNDGADFNQMLLKGASAFLAVGAVAIAAEGEISYAGTSLGLFSAERGSPILERYGGLSPVLVTAIAPDPRHRRVVSVGTGTVGVEISLDAGLTRIDADNVPAAEVFDIATPKKDPGALWVATDRGLFRAVPGSGIVIATSAIKKLRAQWAKEPSLQRTVEEALAYARIDPYLYGDMRARAAVAPLLPRLTMRYEYSTRQGGTSQLLQVLPGEDPPPGAVVGDDQISDQDRTFISIPGTSVSHVFFVELLWDLDELILNPDEVRASRQQPFHHAAERRIVESVQTSFAARRRLMTELAMERPMRGDAGVRARVRDEIRLQELTAELDGQTGGLFSAPDSTPNSTSDSSSDSLSDNSSSKEAP